MLEQIINDLLDCHELTSCKDGTNWMNLWSSKHKAYKVDSAEMLMIQLLGLIEADSGNFETGEQHYIIKVPNRTSSKIKNIDILLNKYGVYDVNTAMYMKELIFTLNKIKTFEFRKLKIKRIKNKICSV